VPSRVDHESAFKGARITMCRPPPPTSLRRFLLIIARWLLCACTWAVILTGSDFILRFRQWSIPCLIFPPLWIASAAMSKP
jgi:hypothetical protein